MKRVGDKFNHIMKIMRSNEAFGVSKRPVGCFTNYGNYQVG